MTLRFGIIGCGRVAPRHAQSLLEIPETRLVAVADIVESKSHGFASKYHANPYLNYHDLIERPDIDAVCVCVPSGLHAQIAIDAMRAGKHVLVEKPMALSLDDADLMIEVAQQTNRHLSIVLQNRFNPPVQRVRRLIDEGHLGKLYLGNACIRWYRDQSYYEDGWHGTLAMDGGALMNQSIHHIDALQWLMGPVHSVCGSSATLAHKMEAEDVGIALIRFSSGALATIEGSTVTWPQNLEGSVSIFGERGSIKIGGTALNRIALWKVSGQEDQESSLIASSENDPVSVYGQSHQTVIHEFALSIINERTPPTPGTEGRKSLELVLAIYESVQTGQWVELSPS